MIIPLIFPHVVCTKMLLWLPTSGTAASSSQVEDVQKVFKFLLGTSGSKPDR